MPLTSYRPDQYQRAMVDRGVMLGALNAPTASPSPKPAPYNQPTRKTSPRALQQPTQQFPRQPYSPNPQQKENFLQYLYRRVRFGKERAGDWNR